MTTASLTSSVFAPTRIGAGIVGGLVGGLAFGMLMQATGAIRMVAMLVGGEALLVGWAVHLATSAFIGATFSVLFARSAVSVARSAAIGVGYGIGWWILGALILMPARLGLDTFVLNTMAWQSLIGHVVYGLLLGAVYPLMAARLQRG